MQGSNMIEGLGIENVELGIAAVLALLFIDRFITFARVMKMKNGHRDKEGYAAVLENGVSKKVFEKMMEILGRNVRVLEEIEVILVRLERRIEVRRDRL